MCEKIVNVVTCIAIAICAIVIGLLSYEISFHDHVAEAYTSVYGQDRNLDYNTAIDSLIGVLSDSASIGDSVNVGRYVIPLSGSSWSASYLDRYLMEIVINEHRCWIAKAVHVLPGGGGETMSLPIIVLLFYLFAPGQKKEKNH